MQTAVLDNPILREVPQQINDSEILDFLYTKDINWKYINAIAVATDLDDDILSNWLNVSIDTLGEYRKPETILKENVKEKLLLLLSLVKHGINVFGTAQQFDKWLYKKNLLFDEREPAFFLSTITGIRFIDDRLTAIEYGDNV